MEGEGGLALTSVPRATSLIEQQNLPVCLVCLSFVRFVLKKVIHWKQRMHRKTVTTACIFSQSFV